IAQWSIGLQREVTRDLVVEATYVGNIEVWGAATFLDQIASNPLSEAILAKVGLSLSNPADRTLLTSLIVSPQAAARGLYPAYPGMPLTQTVAQQLRPAPQFLSASSTLGPFMGKSWYDALQTKATKRFSHGLQIQASFVWSKALHTGLGTETGGVNFVAG